ncbi:MULTISPECIES: bifunctional [glutamate--ammonia ligase]-adenylyl-L-tyrosine phosphorylase/[glutamate--ammonia-ligase] adenylyltransferase [unclassified Aliivibrio]|uniref:bifunctional [glutamate--ammonia ligase]-adenylyl-L-tyrosine phosphorylase/[glutamate--ammonia-ligase] adenylyltransferase n=1 Tax=unclassified Aliivibrio TaxID=2645654 RepID=UPI00080DE4B2|nr:MULTISPECIES: bifunctional [glutamate--ammonia ligase]-adenylyl-L-tyrosine phosphorylase/[glutamate--ammonia-ligase] adenylyltransferase [unclassified Aliivibrio]OCH13241.1 bifunctional glutamine synthetase adenylyltransferase/deadenyltransferase [Aliivibrio sp. 1S165]OCH25242.1 bifunctional glutamine synthetase adenylyltransferase/deadenyltransferase [Aliivibrio sp. 1S128]OCH28069.1 bifunctional glutamine synthetase adenylyltransferase/deadenyltransferase [Aliivibrio sp. 1S175]
MSLPSSLRSLAERRQQELTHLPHVQTWPELYQHQLLIALGCSDFLHECFQQDEYLCQHFPLMFDVVDRSEEYRFRLQELLSSCSDENELMRQLRYFRRREMAYIAWRDFTHDHFSNSNWTLEISLSHLSLLAEALIVESYQWLYKQACIDWGTPRNAQGEEQPMLVIGMGKLGGGELNFSSDIDLIFTYPENGETEGARRSIANAQFFTRLGQKLIKALDQTTVDGFCYRVDLRLRPFGESGPLVMSYAALEDYYQEQGRDWERYAMIKARVMGKETYSHYQELRQMLRPFVFRRYIDFGAIQALRRMKSMITTEVRRRGLHGNIKLGSGGIREVEFIAQVFQLIRGGREPSLRGRGLLETLTAIKELGQLSVKEVDDLTKGYCFLRRLENLLQAIGDQQTQTLPMDERDQTRLAFAMGMQDWAELYSEIERHMNTIHAVFEDLIGHEEEESESSIDKAYIELWDMAHNPEVLEHILQELNPEQAESLTQHIIEFKGELKKKTLGPRGREAITNLMPKLFSVVISREDASDALPRITKLLQAIATRTTYLELLDEHSGALQHLVRLCAASPMVADQLTRYPILLDELLDINQLYNPIELSQYKVELHEFLARIPEDDMEQQMEALRQFKQVCLLRIAASDIAGGLSLMKVSDHLTYLSEAIVEAVINQAWLQVTEKFGVPTHLEGRDSKGFSVIGYGKVGGWELGYNSDLDIVFMHDCDTNTYTNGKKEIDGRQFYLRLAQRIIHIFSVRTSSGILYEVDTRLRPSGASGLLVSTSEAFDEYQRDDAWTWEHQALVRARMIYGDNLLQGAFNKTRHEILCLPRNEKDLQKEVAEMREKMRDHLGGKKAGRFMLKQDIGGITDIEFLAQYLVLNHSHQAPKLTRWSDNVRIFESLSQQGVMDEELCQKLIDAYCVMRNEIHHRNLLGFDADVDESCFTKERETVVNAWNKWFIE